MSLYSKQFHNTLEIRKLCAIFVILSFFVSPLASFSAYANEIETETTTEEVSASEEIVHEETSVENPAIINTGDAISGYEGESVMNVNDTQIDSEAEDISNEEEQQTPTAYDENTSETPESVGEDDATPQSGTEQIGALSSEPTTEELQDDTDTGAYTASTTNSALIENTATVTAQTGENTALGDESVILTGDAIAYANIVNLANANMFNSQGIIAFFNETLGIDTLDLRDAFTVFDSAFDTAVSTDPCTPTACGSDAYTVTTNNDATISNEVIVRAQTGGNQSGDSGAIVTGDAFAAANIFNIANTNIVDSTYLLVSFNNFGDYAGDIVLPNRDILENLFSVNGDSFAGSDIDISNSATINTTSDVSAETGNNTAEEGIIMTGDAYAGTAVQNIVNTNLFGGSDLLLVLRVHGDWTGNIFGLPENIEWTETENGIVLYSRGTNPSAQSTGNQTTLSGTNTAVIENNVSVYALTGENRVGNDGLIATGDAYAASNVTNVANTNIYGQNWALLVFDIFGNWNGNLAFGRPDLWVGGIAELSRNPLMPGNTASYTYTIANNGDATASDVHFTHIFNESELLYESEAGRVVHDGGRTYGEWSLGNIAPGESKELTFTVRVNGALPRHVQPITTEASAVSYETDADMSDNTDVLTIYSGRNSGSSNSGMTSFDAKLDVEKTANVSSILPGNSVDYTITITNHGGPVYGALVRDIMRDESGATTSEQYWDIGTIHTQESISVEYTMEFAETADFGTYVNTADVVGLHRSPNLKRAKSYFSPLAKHTLIIGTNGPEVLGLQTAVCEPYLTSYLRYGADNNPQEVEKLQIFLNEHAGSNLFVTGTFDRMTEDAVRNFQREYASEILEPWGMVHDSGFVYYTTQKKINEIHCNNTTLFSLNTTQHDEILRYHNLLSSMYYLGTKPIFSFASESEHKPSEIVMNDTVITPLSSSNETTQHATEKQSTQTTTLEHSTDSWSRFVMRQLGKLTLWFHGFALR